jgi:hypothetical protein
MPLLLRFLLRHAAIGFVLAAAAVAGLLLADPAGLGTLLWRGGALPIMLLWFFLGLTYGSVQMGVAVMLLGVEDRPSPPAGLAMARVAARRR